MTALANRNVVTGTKTNLSGQYVARMYAPNPDQMMSMRMGDELKKLFTKTSGVSDRSIDPLDPPSP